MSNNLGLTQLTATQTDKTTTINDQAGEIDAALTEILSVDLTSGNVTLTSDEYTENLAYEVTATVASRSVTVPASKKMSIFRSPSTNTEDFTVERGSGSVTVQPDQTVLVYTDGTTNGIFDLSSSVTTTDVVDWLDSVRVATTAAGTLATSFENGDTIDGVVLSTGDRILIKDQVAGAENGIYTVNASGAPTRAEDADVTGDLTTGSAVYIEEGTANATQVFFLSTTGTITIGSTAQVWASINPIGNRPYDFGGFTGGVPGTNTIIMRFLASRAFTLPTSLSDSAGHAGTGPSAQTDFDIQVNGVSQGTMRFAIAATTATFIFASDVSVAAGDRVDIVSPGTVNSIADVSYTLGGLR